MMPLKKLLSVVALACVLPLFATPIQADVNSGRPLWRLFDARHMDTAGLTQAAQFDERGLLYAANARGLLSFDGTNWRLTTTGPVPAAIHSILNLGNGTWLAGGPQRLGTFSPTSLGTHAWQSYPGLVDDGATFADSVLSLLQHQNSIYVITDRNVLVADDDKLSSVFEGDLTGFWFTASPTEFVVATASGLIRITGDKTVPIETPAEWAAIVPVHALDDATGTTIVVTRRSGLFRVAVDNDVLRMTPLWEVLPNALETKIVTAAVQNKDGSFVFGTQTGDVIHLNSDGHLVTSMDERNGFKVGPIHALTARADGNLFAFFDEGAAWINLDDPVRVWDSINGLKGSVRALSLDDSTVYAGTNRGLYRSTAGHRMREVTDVDSTPILTLNVFNRSSMKGHTSLLVGREDGLFDYFDNQLRAITDVTPTEVFVSRTQPTRIAVGTDTSISLFEFERGDWIDLGALGPKTSSPITDFTETPEGDLLVVLDDNTVFRFVADQWLGATKLNELTPASSQTSPRKPRTNAHPTFATDGDNIHLFLPDAGLMWDIRTERFTTDTDLATQFAKVSSRGPSMSPNMGRAGMPSWHSAARQDNLLWLQSHAGSYVMQTDNSDLIQLPLQTNGTRFFNSVLIDQQSSSVLFATPDGITALPVNWADLARAKKSLAKLSLRGITLNGVRLYGGEGPFPPVTISGGVSSLILDMGILDWKTSCGQGDLSMEFLQSGRLVTSAPVNSKCTATVPAADLPSFVGEFSVRLTYNSAPVSSPIDLIIRTTTPWYAGPTGVIGLALLLAGASIAGGQKARRVWPEPTRRYLALFSGLLVCLAIAININTPDNLESLKSIASWFIGLAFIAFFLPIYTEILMRLGDRNWTSGPSI